MEISPGVIKTSKYVYLFCYPGGLGEISPRPEKNWQIETVNLSVKVNMHRTRNKCIIILHHLLQYRRDMENIDAKTTHKKGDKVHMITQDKAPRQFNNSPLADQNS